jgi:SpoVK/Ycf46/Vps4 family AAA+-type ATPase
MSICYRVADQVVVRCVDENFDKQILTVSYCRPTLLLSLQTKLARAIAGEAKAAFIPISPSDVLSKFVGESESAIRGIFERAAEQAFQMESKCAVIFFDEIDALGLSREIGESQAGDGCSRRVLAELLVQLNHIGSSVGGDYHHNCNEIDLPQCVDDGNDCDQPVIQNNPEHARVIVVGATNRMADCDDALKRRFGVQLEVGLPSCRDRKKMIVRYLQDIETTLAQDEIEYISMRTENWTGSDIENLVRDATMAPVRECIKKAAARGKRKSKHCNHEISCIENEVDRESNDRTSLVREIASMRPVAFSDFEKSFSYFTGQDFFMASTRISCTRFDQHKEQDSSSEEEE